MNKQLLNTVLDRPGAMAGWQSSPAEPRPAPVALPAAALNQRAAEVCALFTLEPASIRLLNDNPTVAVAMERFVSGDFMPEARRLLAYAMERRLAVWWAYLSASEAIRHKEICSTQALAMHQVLTWILEPSDANRMACKELLGPCGLTSMVGNLCMAVWVSGGSISPCIQMHIEPEASLCGRLCGVVAYMASVFFDSGRYRECTQHFLNMGQEIARGNLSWEELPALEAS
jgi:hypothetical protein